MDFFVRIGLSLFIVVPVIISLVRFNNISSIYHPFIYCLIIGLVNESLNIWLLMNGHYNVVNSNIYMPLESFIILWQFNRWGLFERNRIWLAIIITVLAITWITENIYFFNIDHFDSYFLITYSFIISLMSISTMNRLIITERKMLIKNPVFIICTSFIMFYTFSVLSEAFWIYGMSTNDEFTDRIQKITVITNFISILLYTVAVLWMPSKQKFTLPSL